MKLIIITGQTATGKTKLALEYAKNPPEGGEGELINCDSRQIYKYLDIITGKDLKKNSKLKTQNSKPQLIISKRINNFEIGFYPISSDSNQFQLISTDFNRFQPIIINQCQQFSTKIWLYDIVDPKQPFSSFDWKKCAQIVIDDIIKRGKIPIIVGGTYLYLKHLLYGVETENIKPNWQLREKLAKKSVEQLQEILKNLSPRLFNQLNQSDKNNPHRLIRKIEIANYLNSTNQSYQSNLSNFSNFKPVS
ncbi:MAG: tRNA (adenosine(37)-N6)-dimethylallyltransferase MiaA, partial [Microgenomates group bacterium]